MNISDIISQKISKALHHIFHISKIELNPIIQRTLKKQPGEYQANGIITIAKKLKKDPYELAKKIIHLAQLETICQDVKISKNGFINFFLKTSWLEKELNKVIQSDRLAISRISKKTTVVIDYSSPNIAKEMHIGHLRSTIIGDAIARIMDFLGYSVIRANHIGDWGTQFGMIIAYLKDHEKKYNINTISLCNLETIYLKAKKKYEINSDFAKKSKEYVVKLQKNDVFCKKIWKKIVNISVETNQKIYEKLNVSLKKKNIIGESTYNYMLPIIVEDLKKKGLAINKDGATIVKLDNFKNRKNKPMGVVIQKKDGAFLYTTIDLACLKYRANVLNADRILYYTDIRQKQHLKQVLEIAKKANYIPNTLKIEHHTFGMMLAKNKKPFQTRTGNNIKLSLLINEAIQKAQLILKKKNTTINTTQQSIAAQKIGIGAIKYADLSRHRMTDYIFNWDRMLSFEGNTAPYMQYAYTRIMSIFRKGNIHISELTKPIILLTKQEIKLSIKLLQFEEIIIQVIKNGTPHLLCNYLYELSTLFSNFYENCSVLFSNKVEILYSRLKIVFLTAKTLKKGLNMLGIQTLSYM